MADLGYTFEPGTDQKKMLNGINKGRLGPTANEALRVLSLKLPSVLGGSPIAPEDLLRPRVGGSGPGGAVLDSLRSSAMPAPAPLVTGANASGPLNVAHFPSGPFGGAPSDTSALGQLAQNAVNPPGGPTFIPGDGTKRPVDLTAPLAPSTPSPITGNPVDSQPGPVGSPAQPSTADMLTQLFHRHVFNREM